MSTPLDLFVVARMSTGLIPPIDGADRLPRDQTLGESAGARRRSWPTVPSNHPAWRRLVAPAAVVVAAAVVVGLFMSRGPMTSAASVAAFVLLGGLGVGTGALARTRWAALVAPLLFAGVVELVRLPVSGPTVDAFRLDTVYGVMAFAVGRGFDSFVLLLPLALGCLWGAVLARRADGVRRGRAPRIRRFPLADVGLEQEEA